MAGGWPARHGVGGVIMEVDEFVSVSVDIPRKVYAELKFHDMPKSLRDVFFTMLFNHSLSDKEGMRKLFPKFLMLCEMYGKCVTSGVAKKGVSRKRKESKSMSDFRKWWGNLESGRG